MTRPMLNLTTFSKNGFVYMPGLQPDSPTLVVAESLGVPLTFVNIPTVQAIRPKSKHMVSANIYSGNYGLDAFPFHTDLAHWYLPPRFLLLRCICPADRVATLLHRHESVISALDPVTIRRALFRPRRKLRGQSALLRLLQPSAGSVIFRWDQLFLHPANDEAAEVATHMQSVQPAFVENRVVFDRPGDTLLIDNWAMLHGRTPVPDAGLHRLVERVYLSEVKS
jgi:L-asparagine oxygenase